MTSALTWQDQAVLALYLLSMIVLGAWLSGRQKTDEEYFLAGRNMPWFAVGVSIIASLLSSLTYLSEPGEVWRSGMTHMLGKMLAIPFEMFLVFLFCVPFMMRFRYTSAYEYLGDRFGSRARLMGVVLFCLMVIMWMGFVVLASSRALAVVSGVSLWTVIATVGTVSTLYTMLGGLRAVIWTDVIQVAMLVGGGFFAIGYVALTTHTFVPTWYESATQRLASTGNDHPLRFFSADPHVRATMVTVGLNMFVWYICTHVANQMTVQRYFSTRDVSAARRSFVTASLFGVGLNLMLMVVGLAMVYYYFGMQQPVEQGLNLSIKEQQDLVFPTFAVHRMPPGMGGAVLAALLAAAMSSIDSGINSLATVVSVEWQQRREEQVGAASHVTRARWLTAVFGIFVTLTAGCLDFLPDDLGIVDAMPRTFNAITGPLGGMFFVGMFIPRARERTVMVAAFCGLATSIGLGYLREIGSVLQQMGLLENTPQDISFTWPMPGSLFMALAVAFLLSRFDPPADVDRKLIA